MSDGTWRIPLPDRIGELWQRWFPSLGPWLAALESWSLQDEIDLDRIDRPVFICGLARSGSTMLLEWLADMPGFTAHRYSDFPALWTPYWWNRLLAQLPTPHGPPVERAHGDGILVTRASPEAFEEPLWAHYFPHEHRSSDVLGANTSAPEFERCLREHIAKLVAARGAQRYVSKGNYNTLRIAFLMRLFPEARFIVPLRAPLEHVASLLRQDARHRTAPLRTLHHIAARGHHEFGPLQRMLRCGPAETEAAAEARAHGHGAEAWLRQWLTVYGHVQTLLEGDSAGAQRIRIVAHERICTDPATVLGDLLGFVGLGADAGAQVRTREIWHARFGTRMSGQADLRARLPLAILAEAESRYGQLSRMGA